MMCASLAFVSTRAVQEWGTSGSTYQFHKRVYGDHFKYPEFAAKFTAELFDADRWMNIIKRRARLRAV